MLIRNKERYPKVTRNQMSFEEWFSLAENYYKEHGNLLVPLKYVTPTGEKLGIWIVNNRKRYADGLLLPDRVRALNSIKMVWNIHEKNWQDMYNLAEEYYKINGNLVISRTYKAPNGANLGTWLSSQRQKYRQGKLTKEKTLALENIGVVWDFKIDNGISHYLKKLKEEGIIIDEEINKDILNHISLIELQSKVKYITDRGALPVDKDGHLIDIFSMASTDIEAKYGISLEALIEAFEVENTRKLYY